MFISNLAHLRLDDELKSFNLELIDTSPEDILEGVKEIEEYANSKNMKLQTCKKSLKIYLIKNVMPIMLNLTLLIVL